MNVGENSLKTGYPSIDKPWKKYYRQYPIREIDVNQTMYNTIFNLNADNLDVPAIGFMGSEMSFRQLKEKTEILAAALGACGLKLGDAVLVGLPACPEAAIIFLALNKIGAISRWFDLRCSSADILLYARESNCSILFGIDMIIPKVREIIDDTNISKVIIANPADTLPRMTRLIYDIRRNTKIPIDNRFCEMQKFLKEYKDACPIEAVGFEINRPAIMIQSSGTTGKPKVIIHTDYSINNMVRGIAYLDLPAGLGKSLFNVIPPWVAYGLIGGMLEPLALGTKVELFPTLDPDSVMKNLGKFSAAVVVPIHLRYLFEHYNDLSEKKKKLLSEVECFISGGDKLSVEENRNFETLFGTKILNGYGNSECLGAITCNPINNNKYGTVGIPKYGDVVAAFDMNTGEERKYGDVGELCVMSRTMFLLYKDNENETDAIKRKHQDGTIWMHTGDLCMVDEDGFVTLYGRIRRVITRAGFKISAYLIEQALCKIPNVKECVVVEVKDDIEEHVPMAFVVLEEGIDQSVAKAEIANVCKRELKTHEIPKYLSIESVLPYTQNGKYDFALLERSADEMIGQGKGTDYCLLN